MAARADPTIRRQVMSAGREVLAADPAATIAQIAARAGVSRATFYRPEAAVEQLVRTALTGLVP